jgi:hypothetical protein
VVFVDGGFGRPRGRVRDVGLLGEFARLPCQVTGLVSGGGVFVETHHLVKRPRHDEVGNLFRLERGLHREFEGGTRRRVVGGLIRAFMSGVQVEYVVGERGLAWLDLVYPDFEALLDGRGGV